MDIRWQQRLQNFRKAFGELKEAVELSKERELSKLEKQGLIQSFEYTHELAWKTLKDFFIDQGNSQLTGSKDVTREAFQNGLIKNGDGWMNMIQSRNQTSHTYNKETADSISNNILSMYFPLFEELINELESRK